MKKLSVSELLQLADLISDLPVEERFDEDESIEDILNPEEYIEESEGKTDDNLNEWVGEDVKFFNNGISISFNIYKDGVLTQELTALELLKSLGNWNAAVAFMMSEERYEYEDHVMPYQRVRMDGMSALMGYPSGHNPDPEADYEDYTESEYGIFFNSRNNIVWVDSIDGESEYEIAQFLDCIME